MGNPDALKSAIANYELAFKMQLAVPEVMDIAAESEATRAALRPGFSFEVRRGRSAGRCLVARRLVERSVHFIELTCPSTGGNRWDQHGNLKQGHENNARAVDQPIAGLLKDLKSRGMLEGNAGDLGWRVWPNPVRAGK